MQSVRSKTAHSHPDGPRGEQAPPAPAEYQEPQTSSAAAEDPEKPKAES